MPPYVGIEVDFGPTAKARERWQALRSHVNLEGLCSKFLTADQFCKRGRQSAVTSQCILYSGYKLITI